VPGAMAYLRPRAPNGFLCGVPFRGRQSTVDPGHPSDSLVVRRAFGGDGVPSTPATKAIALLLRDVVAHQFVLLAEVEAAVGDDRLRPTGALDEVGLEFACEFVLARAGLDRRHDAALVAQDDVTIGVADGGGTRAGTAD